MAEVGLPLVQGSSDLWVLGGYGAEYSLNRGWLQDYAINSTGGRTTNCAPSTATAFLSTGDGTTGSGNGFYSIGRALQVVHAGGTAYPLVTSASYSTSTLQTTVGLGFFSTVGTTSLSTGAITSVGAAPQPGSGLSGSTSPSSQTKFHREDGQWATPTINGSGVTLTKVQKSDVANISTTSTTFVTVTGMSMSHTPSHASNPIHLQANASFIVNTAADVVAVQIYNSTDAVSHQALYHNMAASAYEGGVHLGAWVTLSAAAKTIVLQWKVSSGTGTIGCGSTISGTDSVLELSALEVRSNG